MVMPSRERIEPLLAALREGTPIRMACDLAGLPFRTLDDWLREGEVQADQFEREHEEGYTDPREELPPALLLYREVMAAQAAGRRLAMSVIMVALSKGDVNAARWYLERCGGEDFRPRQDVAVEVGTMGTDEQIGEIMGRVAAAVEAAKARDDE